MIQELFNWFTITADSAGVPYFWATPIGATSVVVILITSLFAMFRTKADIVTVIYNCVLAFISVIALLHVHENSNPRHQMMLLVIAVACKKVWNTYLHIKENKSL